MSRPSRTEAPPILDVRLLGTVELRVGDDPLGPLESSRAVSLLGYLLVHRGEAQPRQRLAFELWPDSTEAQARINLRHVLHALRRGLGDAERWLEVTPRTLRWRTDGPYRLDLADFERALATGTCKRRFRAQRGGMMASTTSSVRALSGRPPRSLSHFAHDHAALFGASALASS